MNKYIQEFRGMRLINDPAPTLSADMDADNNQINNLADPTDAQDAATYGIVQSYANTVSSPNLLIGSYFVQNPWRRGTEFTAATNIANNDGNYMPDRWMYIADGQGDVVDISREATTFNLLSEVVTANTKFGYCQKIRHAECISAIGDNVTCAIRCKGVGITKIRMAIVSWSSTQDVLTHPISTWEAAGTNPVLAANWTYENTPEDITITASYDDYSIAAIPVDTASTENIALLVWCDDTTELDVKDTFTIERCQVQVSDSFEGFVEEKADDVMNECLKYYNQTYDSGTQKGTATTIGRIDGYKGSVAGVELINCNVWLGTFWEIPTYTIYSPVTGAIGNVYDIDGAADFAATVTDPSTTKCIVTRDLPTKANGGGAYVYRYELQAIAEAEL